MIVLYDKEFNVHELEPVDTINIQVPDSEFSITPPYKQLTQCRTAAYSTKHILLTQVLNCYETTSSLFFSIVEASLEKKHDSNLFEYYISMIKREPTIQEIAYMKLHYDCDIR